MYCHCGRENRAVSRRTRRMLRARSFLIICGILEGMIKREVIFSGVSKFERGKIDCDGTCNICALRNANKVLNIDYNMCTRSSRMDSVFCCTSATSVC